MTLIGATRRVAFALVLSGCVSPRPAEPVTPVGEEQPEHLLLVVNEWEVDRWDHAGLELVGSEACSDLAANEGKDQPRRGVLTIDGREYGPRSTSFQERSSANEPRSSMSFCVPISVGARHLVVKDEQQTILEWREGEDFCWSSYVTFSDRGEGEWIPTMVGSSIKYPCQTDRGPIGGGTTTFGAALWSQLDGRVTSTGPTGLQVDCGEAAAAWTYVSFSTSDDTPLSRLTASVPVVRGGTLRVAGPERVVGEWPCYRLSRQALPADAQSGQ